MPLSIVRTAASAVYGGVDLGAEYADQMMLAAAQKTTPTATLKPFQNITDISRAAAAVGGAVGSMYLRGQMSEVAEAVELGAIPLLEKSIANAILTLTGNTTVTHFSPRGMPRGQIMVRRPTSQAAGNIPGSTF